MFVGLQRLKLEKKKIQTLEEPYLEGLAPFFSAVERGMEFDLSYVGVSESKVEVYLVCALVGTQAKEA